MNRRIKNSLLVLKVLFLVGILAFGMPVVVSAQDPLPLPDGCFPGELPDSVNPEQIILTCLPVPPVEFNGVLLIYAHGYVKPQKPLALPFGELEEFLPLIGIFQLQGFAFGTTSYSTNGLAVEQAERDLNALVSHFRSLLGPSLVKVLLVGASEGGLITTMMIEKHPDIYDGGLAMCGPLAGMPYQVKYLADFRMVFDYFFPGLIPLEGLYDDTAVSLNDWEMPGGIEENIINAVNSNPALAEQLSNVTRAAFNPLNPGESAADILSFTVLGMNDAVEKAGGRPYGNRFRWYQGSENDIALNTNIERVRSDYQARQYMRRFYRTRGILDRPLVTLHNIFDHQVPYRHELFYGIKVALQGRSHNLLSIPIDGFGHCSFSPEQLLGALFLLIFMSSY